MTTNRKSLSLRRLIRRKQPSVNPHVRNPDNYYQRVWITKKLYQGIEMIAAVEQIPVRKATLMLIEDGYSKYMARVLSEPLHDPDVAHRLGRARKGQDKYKRLRFMLKKAGIPKRDLLYPAPSQPSIKDEEQQPDAGAERQVTTEQEQP